MPRSVSSHGVSSSVQLNCPQETLAQVSKYSSKQVLDIV